MRRFRRRRRALAWFPTIGSNVTVGEVQITKAAQSAFFSVSGDGDINFFETAVTFDFGQERLEQFADANIPTQTLNDLMGSGWQLRRIVGSVFCHRVPTGVNAGDITANQVPALLVTAGWMVRKVGQDGGVVDTATNTQERRDITDPWIWRRSWILGQGSRPVINRSTAQLTEGPSGLGVGTDDLLASYAHYPTTNAGYGSLREGTAVDQKCNRIIGPEDRLFFHMAAQLAPPSQPPAIINGTSVAFTWDVRYLGNLRRFTNRRNASR